MAHPLDGTDRPIILDLNSTTAPSHRQIIDCARLLNRHEPGTDLRKGLDAALRKWGTDKQQVQAQARAVWTNGWRPTNLDDEAEVGSGSDVQAA